MFCRACRRIYDRGIGSNRIRVPAWRVANEDGVKRAVKPFYVHGLDVIYVEGHGEPQSRYGG